MRTGYQIVRRKEGFSRLGQTVGEASIYVFSYGKITRNGRKGLFQFALAQRSGMAVPHIFFTCPKCGAINKDYLTINGIERRMEGRWDSNRLIRACHNCGNCGVALPYTLRMSFSELKAKYYALLKEAKKGEPI